MKLSVRVAYILAVLAAVIGAGPLACDSVEVILHDTCPAACTAGCVSGCGEAFDEPDARQLCAAACPSVCRGVCDEVAPLPEPAPAGVPDSAALASYPGARVVACAHAGRGVRLARGGSLAGGR